MKTSDQLRILRGILDHGHWGRKYLWSASTGCLCLVGGVNMVCQDNPYGSAFRSPSYIYRIEQYLYDALPSKYQMQDDDSVFRSGHTGILASLYAYNDTRTWRSVSRLIDKAIAAAEANDD